MESLLFLESTCKCLVFAELWRIIILKIVWEKSCVPLSADKCIQNLKKYQSFIRVFFINQDGTMPT